MSVIVNGVVKDGVIVPSSPLPEGTHVEIKVMPVEVPPELQEELDGWDRASDEALMNFERMLEDKDAAQQG